MLREVGVPATVFLTTDYIDSFKAFWFDRVAHQFQVTLRQHVAIPSIDLDFSLAESESRRRATEVTLAAMKRVPEAIRLSTLEDLQAATGVSDVEDGSEPLT